MKLFYSPGACSLSPHIVLREAGYDFTLDKVDFASRKTETGQDYTRITEKSLVPALQLDNGETLTEGMAIVQYLADQKPGSGLAPKNGTFERVRLQEWLSYISTEMHKTYFPLFHPETGPKAAEVYLQKLKDAYTFVSGKLKGKDYLMGDQFSVADAYLFTVVNWHNFIKVDLSPWPVLVEYQKRVGSRPKVREALKAEGLA